jgi:hypothetical protein
VLLDQGFGTAWDELVLERAALVRELQRGHRLQRSESEARCEQVLVAGPDPLLLP